MFLGKPSLRILLCRKDLPLAWLSSLQVPPMQPRRQQLPASQPREGDSAWPDSTACRPAGTPRWPPGAGDEMMEPEARFASNTWRGDAEEGPPCPDMQQHEEAGAVSRG